MKSFQRIDSVYIHAIFPSTWCLIFFGNLYELLLKTTCWQMWLKCTFCSFIKTSFTGLWLIYSAASCNCKQLLVSSVHRTIGSSLYSRIYSITGIKHFCTCTYVTPDRCLSILIWKDFSNEDFTPTLSHTSAVLGS